MMMTGYQAKNPLVLAMSSKKLKKPHVTFSAT